MMTRDEARKAAAVMMAYAEGKQIQVRMKCGGPWETSDPERVLRFNWAELVYRIKPEVVRYRRALFHDTRPYIGVSYSDADVKNNLNRLSFVRWIDTEWQEEEV
jgi:hypothetical protein